MIRIDTKMHALSEAEFQAVAEPLFHRVFINQDPFDRPFAPDVQIRRILFPVYYEVESPLLEALVTAASAKGDIGFYLTVLERPAENDQDCPYHWYVPFSDIAGYHSLGYPFVLENAIYSPHGSWGMMISHENHALLGATSDFIDIVGKFVPNLDVQVFEFLSVWEDNKVRFGSNIKWLPGLVEHTYGPDTAERLLKQHNLL